MGYWDYGPTFKPKTVSDASSSVTYGGTWATVSDPGAFGGGLHRADAAGASARLSFYGRDVAWIATRGPGMGTAKVYLNGVLRATIDLSAGVDAPRSLVFRFHWSSLKTREIRIDVQGTVGHPVVTLDGFVVNR